MKLEIPSGTTSAIVRACKSRGCSVTAALHAGLISATQLIDSRTTRLNKHISWGTFNSRPHVQPDYGGHTHAVSVYLIGFPVTFEHSNFPSDIEQLNDIDKQFLAPLPPFKVETHLTPYIREATALFSRPQPADFAAPTEPILGTL